MTSRSTYRCSPGVTIFGRGDLNGKDGGGKEGNDKSNGAHCNKKSRVKELGKGGGYEGEDELKCYE